MRVLGSGAGPELGGSWLCAPPQSLATGVTALGPGHGAPGYGALLPCRSTEGLRSPHKQTAPRLNKQRAPELSKGRQGEVGGRPVRWEQRRGDEGRVPLLLPSAASQNRGHDSLARNLSSKITQILLSLKL